MSIYDIVKKLLNKGGCSTNIYVHPRRKGEVNERIIFVKNDLVHNDASCIIHLILDKLQLTATYELNHKSS